MLTGLKVTARYVKKMGIWFQSLNDKERKRYQVNVFRSAGPPLAVEGHLGDEGMGLEHDPEALVVDGQQDRLKKIARLGSYK